MMDTPVLILLGLAALGVVSKNDTVAIAMLALAFLRVTNLHHLFPFIEKHGITLGVIVLTLGVMAPIASGKIGMEEIMRTFTHWQSLLAIVIGVFVAYLGARGVSLLTSQPLIVTGLLLGTIIGVALFRGIPVGPLIAAGLLALLIGAK